MNLQIGNTNLAINSFLKIRDAVVGVYAKIEIPTTEISYEELKALFTDNANDLIVTDEETTTTYSGYAGLDEIREKGGMYTVIQLCTSEPMHLLNETRKQIETQAEQLVLQGNVITEQGKSIAEHQNTIAAQNVIIEQQTELVGVLEETSAMQMATIESLLLEVIPAVIADAVAEALASTSTEE